MLGAVVFGHEQMQVAIRRHQRARSRGRQAASGTWTRADAERRADERRSAAMAESELTRGLRDHREAAARTRQIGEIKSARASSALAGGDAPSSRGRCRSRTTFFELEYRDRARADPRRRSRASTAATRAPCARSAIKHRRVAAHARLGAVHPRRDPGAGRHDARHRRATRRSSMRSRASAKSRSCCTTISRRSRSARPA